MPLHPHLSDLSDAEFDAYTLRVEIAMAHYHAHYNNTTYQAIQKKEAGGGLDTELLNAENARLKAQIDNINNRKSLNDLQNPE